MKLVQPFLTMVAIAALSAAPASALQILYVEDGRSIRADASYVPYSDSDAPTPPFSDFRSDVYAITIAAGQTSSLDATSMTGTGYVWSDSGGGQGAESRFEVSFFVDEDAWYTFTGVAAGVLNPQTITEIRLYDAGGELFNGDGTHEGALEPGTRYTLAVGVESAQSRSWQLNFSIAPIPEPGTGALLATGLFGLALRYARR